MRGRGSAEWRNFAAIGLYNLMSLNAGRRQVEGIGYTQYWLRELLAERSPEH
jgi:hypothetical protein